MNLARILVLELDEAAATAAIAKTLPFLSGKCFERLDLPKAAFCLGHHLVADA